METAHRPEPDNRRIDILNPFETPYWLKALDVTEHELLVAVDKVGTSAGRVRRFLGEHPPGM